MKEAYTDETAFESNDLFPLAQYVPHCAVIQVLDTSHSMWGKGLTDMKQALAYFYDTIRKEEFQNAEIDLAAVSMGDNLCMLEEFTPFTRSKLPTLAIRPKGDTPIGAALKLAYDKLLLQKEFYHSQGMNYVTPHLIILSDGKRSSDDFSDIADTIQKACADGELFCHAIAMGDSPDHSVLRQIAGTHVMTPRYGDLRNAFGDVGKIVSKTYENEVETVFSNLSQAQPAPLEAVIDVTPGFQDEPLYLLDGSNIMHWNKERDGISLRYVLAITNELQRQGKKFNVYFDATARHILAQKSPDEGRLFEDLLKKQPDHFKQVPAGTCADTFLLYHADANPNSLIMTNDQFNEHAVQYPWVKERGRLLHGMVVGDVIYFPEKSLNFPVASTGNDNS